MLKNGLLLLTLIFSSFPLSVHVSAQQTSSPEDSEQWYHWTDDRVRHYVYSFGEAEAPGDTVVVLHGGWGAEHSYLIDPFIEPAKNHRFVFYDQRGSLRSPAPDSLLTLEKLVSDLDHLREMIGLETLNIAAHSMGNALAYAYLNQFPDRVESLILIGPVLPAPFSSGSSLEFAKKVWPEVDSSQLIKDSQEFMSNAYERAKQIALDEGFLPDSLKDTDPQNIEIRNTGEGKTRTRVWRIFFTAVNTCSGENWREMKGGQAFYNSDVAPAIFNNSPMDDVSEEFWPALQAFDGPIRVIIGTCDYVDVGPAIWPKAVQELDNAEISVIDGAGHSAWMDQPDAFNSALKDALNEVTE